jgi:hypothetical protein
MPYIIGVATAGGYVGGNVGISCITTSGAHAATE